MEFKRTGQPVHSGTERCEYVFALSGKELDAGDFDMWAFKVRYQIRPNMVVLVWERSLGGVWSPADAESGCMFYGSRVRQDGTLSHKHVNRSPVWRDTARWQLMSTAADIPGFTALIDEITENLPK